MEAVQLHIILLPVKTGGLRGFTVLTKKMAVDIAGHPHTQVGRPWKYKEEWSSTNKRICISLTQCLLSGESYVQRTP